MLKVKAPKGHKCCGTGMAVTSYCECGWASEPFTGKGARAAAYQSWRWHVVSHGAERSPN